MSSDLIKELINRHGWRGLFPIIDEKPFGSTLFKISTGEYISNFYKSADGQYNWMYFASLYAEWFPFSTRDQSYTYDIIPIDVIEKYSDVWNVIFFFGDTIDIARHQLLTMSQCERYYFKLKHAIELYDSI